MAGWWFAAFAASATWFAKAIALLKPLRANVRVIVSPSRRHAPASSSRASAASSSVVSFSGSAIAAKATQRDRLGARALREQTTEADSEHDPAAEVHDRAAEDRRREDPLAEERAGCQRPENVREPPHREARTHSARAL